MSTDDEHAEHMLDHLVQVLGALNCPALTTVDRTEVLLAALSVLRRMPVSAMLQGVPEENMVRIAALTTRLVAEVISSSGHEC